MKSLMVGKLYMETSLYLFRSTIRGRVNVIYMRNWRENDDG